MENQVLKLTNLLLRFLKMEELDLTRNGGGPMATNRAENLHLKKSYKE